MLIKNKRLNNLRTAFIAGAVNIFEWYDYALFGLFAQIIGDKFFPSNDPAISLLNAFLVFAVGYLIRPIGGVVFGAIGDIFGRKIVLTLSVICISIPTFIVGILPTYQSIGITSTIIMVIVRLLQGLAIGGALTGSVTFVVEHAENSNKGLAASIPMAGICVGVLLGSSVAYLTKSLLMDEAFISWGWRVPFLLAILIMFVGFYVHKYGSETPEFHNNKIQNQLTSSPIKQVFLAHKLDILISIFLNATGSVLFYFQVIYITNYFKMQRQFESAAVDQLLNYSYILMAFAALFGGWVADRIGKVKSFALVTFLVFASSALLINVFAVGDFQAVTKAHLALSILAALYIGIEPVIQCSLYPSYVRNTALSIAYNVATTIFGGTTPYVMQLLLNKGDISFAATYISCCSILSIVALYFYTRRAKIDQNTNASFN